MVSRSGKDTAERQLPKEYQSEGQNEPQREGSRLCPTWWICSDSACRLTAIHRSFLLIRDHREGTFSLATIPKDDPETFAMIRNADTVGVFQIESCAPMSMPPRIVNCPVCFLSLIPNR